MRRSKELIVLLALLFGAMAFVLGYVVNRRAKNRAAPPAAAGPSQPGPTPAGPGPTPVTAPVNLAEHDRKTVDFSSGQPVVKDSAADQAAIDAAMKDIAEATKGVTFEPRPHPQPAGTAKP